jgi:hypothetical protein
VRSGAPSRAVEIRDINALGRTGQWTSSPGK